MTDVTHYEFKTFDGWPPDGEPGDFFGFDAGWRPCVLKWFRGKWCGLRTADSDDLFPEAFVRAPDTESYVVRWAPAPMRTLEQKPWTEVLAQDFCPHCCRG